MKMSSDSMKYTDEMLMLYILGINLSAQQREEIEEAYFRDDETFRRVRELELELVEAHVSGKLPEDNANAVADLVGRSKRLQEHARLAEALKRVAFRAPEGPTSIRINWMQALRSFWGFWKLASAVLTIIAVPLMTISLWRITHQGVQYYAQAIPRLLVAARDLEVGTVIQNSDLKWPVWHGSLPQGALYRPAEAIGRRVIQPIYEGEPVVDTRLGAKDELFLSVTQIRVSLTESVSNPSQDNAGTTVSLGNRKSLEFVEFMIPVGAPRDCMLSSIVISNIDRREVVPRSKMLGLWETASQGPLYMVVRVPAAALRRPGNWSLTVDAGCGGASGPRTAEYKFTVQ